MLLCDLFQDPSHRIDQYKFRMFYSTMLHDLVICVTCDLSLGECKNYDSVNTE